MRFASVTCSGLILKNAPPSKTDGWWPNQYWMSPACQAPSGAGIGGNPSGIGVFGSLNSYQYVGCPVVDVCTTEFSVEHANPKSVKSAPMAIHAGATLGS